MERASFLASALALAILAAGWALLGPPWRRPPLRLVASPPRAVNAEEAPLSRFDAGAIVELTAAGTWLNGEALRAAGGAPALAAPAVASDLPELTAALERRREEVEERHARGEGPAFSGALLLAASADVPYRRVTLALGSAGIARFTEQYALVADPHPAPPAPRPPPAAGRGVIVLMREDQTLQIAAYDPSLPGYAVSSERSFRRGDLAAAVREAGGERGAPGCVQAAFRGDLPWGEAAAVLDELAALGAGLLPSTIVDPTAEPALPQAARPAPAAEERSVHVGNRVPALRLAFLSTADVPGEPCSR